MSNLTGLEIKNCIKSGSIKIQSLEASLPFNGDDQVTEDSIDLRLYPTCLIYKSNVKEVDVLSENTEQYFERIDIPIEGFVLKRNQVLFTQTLEAISLPPDLMGEIVTRSTFARFGLSVHCSAPKFACGISWAFPLQLCNHTDKAIRIYPYMMIAQLVITDMKGASIGYKGRYNNTFKPTSPKISQRERDLYGKEVGAISGRTGHILLQEIKLENDKHGTEINALKVEQTYTKSRSGHSRHVAMAFNLLAGASLAFSINILSSDVIDYWKAVAAVVCLLSSVAISSMLTFFPDQKS